MMLSMQPEVEKKKKNSIIKEIIFEKITEGKYAQVVHDGPYSAEPETINMLLDFIADNGLSVNGLHHEIYLSDPRKTAPEKMKTIIRYPVKWEKSYNKGMQLNWSFNYCFNAQVKLNKCREGTGCGTGDYTDGMNNRIKFINSNFIEFFSILFDSWPSNFFIFLWFLVKIFTEVFYLIPKWYYCYWVGQEFIFKLQVNSKRKFTVLHFISLLK